jgi:hypothetical protein
MRSLGSICGPACPVIPSPKSQSREGPLKLTAYTTSRAQASAPAARKPSRPVYACLVCALVGLCRGPHLYCCSFSSAHSVCSSLSHTPLHVPCWAVRPLLKWKRALGKSLRNLGCSTVRPTTPPPWVPQGTSLLRGREPSPRTLGPSGAGWRQGPAKLPYRTGLGVPSPGVGGRCVRTCRGQFGSTSLLAARCRPHSRLQY